MRGYTSPVAGFAALALSLSLQAWAADAGGCGRPDKKGRVPRMPAVLACQQGARQAFAEKARKRTGREPSPEAQDRFDDFQRAEMRTYMEEHPAESTIDGEAEEERKAEAAQGPAGVLGRVGAAVGLAKDKLGAVLGGTGKAAKPKPEDAKAAADAETEARGLIGGLKDGERMGEVDLESIAAKVRQDPKGALKRAVRERNKEFEENVPDEAKAFYKKPGAKAAPPPADEE